MTLPLKSPKRSQGSEASEGSAIQGAGRRLVQDHKSSARWLQIILDLVLVVGLLIFHTWLKGTGFNTDYRILAILTTLLMAVIYHINGVYQLSTSQFDRFLTLLRSWAIVLALIVLAGFATKTSTAYSREILITWSITAFIAQYLSFLGVRFLQSRSQEDSIPTLIVGTDRLGMHLAEHINGNPWVPDQVVGLIGEGIHDKGDATMPILGDVEDVSSVIKAYGIRRIYLALPMQHAEWIKPIYLELAEANVDIIWAPDIFSVDLLNHSIREMGGVPLISLSETPLIGSNAFIKTLMDFSIAMGGLIVLSPIMLITALIIKATSAGPVLFSQQRHGWDGKIITIYKFRSMALHEEDDGHVTQASKGDARITWIGRIIRRTSIDELPQLFNVLNGSMSIVGPRPHAVAHNAYYGERIKDYMRRHRVKPGLTGLAQVNGFRGETEDISLMEGRVQHDLAYINNWSTWLDIKIIIRTVFVLFGKNAY